MPGANKTQTAEQYGKTKQLLSFDFITTFMEFIVAFHKYDLRCSQEGLEQRTWL